MLSELSDKMTENTPSDVLNDESDSESVTKQPRRARVLSSSDDDNDVCPTSEPLKDITNDELDSSAPVNKSVNKYGFKSSLITDSDVEYDNDSEPDLKSDAAGPENVPCFEESNEKVPEFESGKVGKTAELPKKKKKSKNTLSDKLAIRSETQRLEREKTVDLPYHRPKQRSLREFLSRKKNQLNENSLRLSSSNMLHTWEQIDKSIKETAEFFKSESEDEPEEEQLEIQQSSNTPEEKEIECKSDEKEPTAEIEPTVVEKTSTEVEQVVENTEVENSDVQAHSSDKSDVGEEALPDELDALDTIANTPTLSRKDKAAQWLDTIAAYERREAFKNKLQLSPTILNKVPTLSNDLDEFIDLDESPKTEVKPGVKQLMERMFKGLERNSHSAPQTLTTTYTEKDEFGNIKNVGIEITPLSGSPSIVENEKPGVKRQQLKEKLKMEIEAKWEKEFKERNAVGPAKEGFEIDAEDDEEFEEPELEEECSTTDSETEPEEEEEDQVVEKPRRFCAFGDSEAEESNDDDGCDGDDESEHDDNIDQNTNTKEKDDEELDCSMLPAFQPGGGFSEGGSFISQQSQPLPIKPFSPLSSPANLTPKSNRDDGATPLRGENVLSSFPEVDSTVKKNLFGEETNAPITADNHDVEDEADDPFLFVSGAFPDLVNQKEELASQSLHKRIITPDESEDSRGVESNHEVVADDDDQQSTLRESTVLEDDDVQLTVKKINKPLVFSDDEEDDTPLENVEENADDNALETNSTEEPDVGIDDVNYDSEENEVRPGEFFDKEAELSESEWSGDEDEKGLDALEAEAGDADVFDENEVASQLGRIHMRQVLDADARDVRRIQEILLEDGDLYTEGGPRERNYRWKNIDGFDWNSVYKSEDVANGDVLELSDRAKLRFEKQQFLMKAQQEGKLEEIEESAQDKSSLLVLGRQMLQRLQPQPVAANGPSKTPKLFPRGSFLTKDKSFLTRIARVTAGGNDAPLLGASHSKNFTFAVQDRIEEISSTYSEGCKRKAEVCVKTVKRSRMLLPDSFLDQLRPTETPSHL